MALNILAADMDMDGDQDLAVFDPLSDRVAIVLNKGSRVFRSGEPIYLGKQTFPIAAEDLDGDGDMDLVTCYEDLGRITFLLGNGRGGFSRGPPLLSGGGAFRGTARDVDADGQVDLVIANGKADDVAVMFHLRKHLQKTTNGGEAGDSSEER